MKNEPLPFDKCLRLLEHSFLKVAKLYRGQDAEEIVQFQHPSIRDMLLEVLRGDGNVRRQYLSMISAEGLPSIIEAVPLFGSRLGDAPHRLVLHTEDELDLLCERIRLAIKAPIPSEHLEGILATSVVLLPGRGRAGTVDLDTKVSRTSPSQRVLREVLDSVCTQTAYDTKTEYSLRSWIPILHRIYELSIGLPSPPRPSYLGNLVEIAASSELSERISLYRILQGHESQLFKNICTEDVEETLRESLAKEVQRRIDAYQGLPDQCSDDDEHETYSLWTQETKRILEVADEYFTFASQELPEIDDLQDSLEIVEERIVDYERKTPEPPEEEYDDYEEWTISEIFEDL
jgi:hypothetical protein